jgi:hypothetical protein
MMFTIRVQLEGSFVIEGLDALDWRRARRLHDASYLHIPWGVESQVVEVSESFARTHFRATGVRRAIRKFPVHVLAAGDLGDDPGDGGRVHLTLTDERVRELFIAFPPQD